MRILHHQWLDPFCRRARIALAEKKIEFDLKTENVWERRQEFLVINPAGEVPALIEPDGTAISGSDVICEYLDEIQPNPPLLGEKPIERAEARRLVAWFDRKFNAEVTQKLVGERVFKRYSGVGQPDSQAIRAGLSNINYHLEYITFLVERRSWLAGEEITYADFAAAAHLSTIDYLGDVPWSKHGPAKDWYACVKSRPSFRALLSDRIPGLSPPSHYADLDF